MKRINGKALLYLFLLVSMGRFSTAAEETAVTVPGLESEKRGEHLECRDQLISAQLEYGRALSAVLSRSDPQGEDLGILWSRAEYLLAKLFDLCHHTGHHADLLQLLENVQTDPLPPLLRARLQWTIAQLHLLQGRAADAQKATAPLGLIRGWLLAGPFDNERGRSFDTPFIPENWPLKLNTSMTGKNRNARWRPHHSSDPLGLIHLDAIFQPNTECLAYALCLVKSPTAQDAALRLGSDDGLKVWLNGQLIARNQAQRDCNLDQDASGCRLQKGWNLLTLKVTQATDNWAFAARLTDPAGKPLEGLAYSHSLKSFTQHLPSLPDTPRQGSAPPVDQGAISALARAVNEAPTPEGRPEFYLGNLFFLRKHLSQTELYDRQLLRKAAQMAPDNGLAWLMLARMTASQKRSAPDREENERRLALAEATAVGENHVAAHIALARYYFESMQNQYRAEDLLKKALKGNPQSLRARLLQFDLCLERGWLARAERQIAEAVRRSPRSATARARYSRLLTLQGRTQDALREAQKALAIDATNRQLVSNTALLLQLAGRSKEAGQQLRSYLALRPYDHTIAQKLIELQVKGGAWDQAIAAADRRLSQCPEDYNALSLRAEAYMGKGNRKAADADRQKALALHPSFTRLKNYMQTMSTEDSSEDSRAVDLAALAEKYRDHPAPSHHGKLYLLHDTRERIQRDGTRSRTDHRIVRVLNREGAESLRHTRIFYAPEIESVTVRRARVLHPDGRIENARRSTTRTPRFSVEILSFSSLKRNAVVEVLYSIDRNKPDFFGDYFGREVKLRLPAPSIRIRYELIHNRDQKIYIHTLGPVPEARMETTKEGETSRLWTMGEQAGFEDEENMPPDTEVLPMLQISTFKDWSAMATWYHHLIKGQNVITDPIRSILQRLTQGLQSDEAKLNALLQFASHDIRNVAWAFGVHGYKPYSAQTIVTRRFGDCKDKSTIINVMARELGYEAWPVLVYATDPSDRVSGRGQEDLSLPMLNHFNHCISMVRAGGKTYFLDGTIGYRTIEGIHFTIAGGEAVIVRPKSAERIRLPVQQGQSNLWEEQLQLNLESDGNATFQQKLTTSGNAALFLRAYFGRPGVRNLIMQRVATRHYGQTKSADVAYSTAGLGKDQVHMETRLRITPFAKRRDEALHYRLPKAWLRGDLTKGAALPGELTQFVRYSQREHDLILPMPFSIDRQFTISWPAAYQLVNPPQPVQMEHPFGSLLIKADILGSTMTLHHRLTVDHPRIPKAAYPHFREMCIRSDQLDRLIFRLVKKDKK